MKMAASLLLFFSLILTPAVFAEESKTYYPSGKIQMEMTEKGIKTYYEDGKLNTDTPLVDNVPNGTAKTYYPSGKLMTETEYKNGEPVGATKMYYENGQLMHEDDTAKGTWKQYDESGHLTAEGKH